MWSARHLRKIVVAVLLLQAAVASQLVADRVLVVDAASDVSLSVVHTIQVRNGGLIITNTTVILQNSAAASLASLKIGFPKGYANNTKSFINNLDSASALDSQGRGLSIAKEDTAGNVSWFNVGFAEPVKTGQTLSLSVLFVFSGLVFFDSSSTPISYTAVFPSAPALPFDASRCDVTVMLPEGDVPTSGSLSDLLGEVDSPLAANSNKVGHITFTGDTQILACNSASREITVDSWGGLSFSDTYTIRNIGPTALTSIAVPIPADAQNVAARDAQGALTTTVNSSSSSVKLVAVNFRYSLNGRETAASLGDVGIFTVSYTARSSMYVSSTNSWFGYRLAVSSPTSLNVTIRSLSLRVTLPEGAKYQSSSPSGTILTSGLAPSLTCSFKNATPTSFSSLNVEYDYVVLWAALRPTIWVGVAAALVGVVVLHRRRAKHPSPEASDRRQRLIASFTEAFDEKIMLWSELDSLEDDLDGRRVGRRDYSRKKTVIQQRMEALNGALSNFKKDIRGLGARYSERMNRIDRAEADAESARNSFEAARAQLRSGKVSRRVFADLRAEYDRKIGHARGIIESLIIEFRGDMA